MLNEAPNMTLQLPVVHTQPTSPDSLWSHQAGGDHYLKMPVQPWDVMRALLSPLEWLAYLKGNMLKYAMRAGRKGDTADEDKQKYEHYKLMYQQERKRLQAEGVYVG